MVPFDSLGAFFYSPSIVPMALFGIISEIKPDIVRKSWRICVEKLEWWDYPMAIKTLRICVTVYTQYRCVTDGWRDGETDRQTDILPRHSPRYAAASRGKNSRSSAATDKLCNNG